MPSLWMNLLFRRTFSRNRRCFSTTPPDLVNASGQRPSHVEHFDVLVVGGGLVGASATCSIASTPELSHLKIGLIEPSSQLLRSDRAYTHEKRLPDLRVLSISPANADFLKDIGVWKFLQLGDEINSLSQTPSSTPSSTSSATIIPGVPVPFLDMHVSCYDSKSHFLYFHHSTLPSPCLGYIVENSSLQRALYHRLSELQSTNDLHIICPDQLVLSPSTLIHSPPTFTHLPTPPLYLTTKNGHTFSTQLLVVADGSGSPIRNHLSIPTVGWSYHQAGLVSILQHESPNHTARQMFLDDSILGILPLWDTYSAAIWSLPLPLADQYLSMPESTFVSHINEIMTHSTHQSPSPSLSLFGSLLPQLFPAASFLTPPPWPIVIASPSKRATFPLHYKHATTYIDNRIALIGDSAHTIHPLAGLGFNLGLKDVVSLTRILALNSFTGQDIGSALTLQQYENERKFDNQLTSITVNTLYKLFRVSSPWLKYARAIGMDIVNYSNLKQIFQKIATGFD